MSKNSSNIKQNSFTPPKAVTVVHDQKSFVPPKATVSQNQGTTSNGQNVGVSNKSALNIQVKKQ